jgi:hypothetical protein
LLDDSINTNYYFTTSHTFASTGGGVLRHPDFLYSDEVDTKILFADDDVIFLRIQIDTIMQYSAALFAYYPCSSAIPLAIKNENSENDITLFPNPVTKNLRIQLSDRFISSRDQVLITDLTGRKILSEEKIPQGNLISLLLDENMANGMYLLTVWSEQNSAQALFEIQK